MSLSIRAEHSPPPLPTWDAKSHINDIYCQTMTQLHSKSFWDTFPILPPHPRVMCPHKPPGKREVAGVAGVPVTGVGGVRAVNTFLRLWAALMMVLLCLILLCHVSYYLLCHKDYEVIYQDDELIRWFVVYMFCVAMTLNAAEDVSANHFRNQHHFRNWHRHHVFATNKNEQIPG